MGPLKCILILTICKTISSSTVMRWNKKDSFPREKESEILLNEILRERESLKERWQEFEKFARVNGEKAKTDPRPPLLVEEDIATDEEENLFRLGLRWDLFPLKRWKNNTIPYVISTDYAPREYLVIKSAIKTFEFMSCLTFEEWDGRKEDYLNIHPSKTRPGCWSYIGRRGGRQDLSLRPPDEKSCHCLCDPGRTLHEMMHALGFYHEHSRPDRDLYIQIVKKNVKKGKIVNFSKKTFDTTISEFAYDYDSIMHYGSYYFSKDKSGRKETIVPLKPGIQIGQRKMLSPLDCMKLNQQFGCFDKTSPWRNKKIQIMCGFMGHVSNPPHEINQDHQNDLK